MKDAIADILLIQKAILLPWAEGDLYWKWGDDFKKLNAKGALELVKNIKVDFSGISHAEAEMLGFPVWSEDLDIRLIPLWLYRFIKPGQSLTCISGKTLIVPEDYMDSKSAGYIDNDHRGGFLAYGFVPSAT